MRSKLFCILSFVFLFDLTIKSPAAIRDNNIKQTILFNIGNKYCGTIQSFIDGGIAAQIPETSQSPNTFAKKNIMKPEYLPFVIETGFNMDPIFNQWIASSWEAISPAKRDCGMEIMQGMPPVKNLYKNCTIIETTIPACGSDSEESGALKLVIDFENIDNSGTLKSTVPELGGITRKWESNQFKLEIDGIDCANVKHIDSFSIKRKLSENEVGAVKLPSADAGRIVFPNINVTVIGNGIESWENWAKDFIVNGNNADSKEKNGRLIFYSDPTRTKEIARIEFKNLGIFSLKHDYEVNSSTIIAGLYCEQMIYNSTASGSSAPEEPAPDEARQPTDDGQLGVIYAMGGQFPLNFRLNSAEYTTRQVNIGKRLFAPAADEKLLVLHFTIINPAERARTVRFDSLMINCSDETNTNKPAEDWGIEANKAALSNQIEQNQPVDAYTVITLSARGPANRLTVRVNQIAADNPS